MLDIRDIYNISFRFGMEKQLEEWFIGLLTQTSKPAMSNIYKSMPHVYSYSFYTVNSHIAEKQWYATTFVRSRKPLHPEY